MAITPEQLTRVLADPTRLRITLLLGERGELCVCDLTHALDLPQPKISRHLAVLREAKMLLDRRAGQWIHYRLHPDLPAWVVVVINSIAKGSIGKQPYETDRRRLEPAIGATGTCG